MSTFEVSGKRYTSQELLRYWIDERELIRQAKESGLPKPWTSDPVFQRTYFTNVHREDDRVTRWIREHYTVQLLGEYYEPAIVAARIFNRISTLEHFRFKWFPISQPRLNDLLQEWGDTNKTWGNAYVITTHGQKMSKVDFCVRLLQEAEDKLPVPFTWDDIQCQNWYEHLMKIDGIGSFLAAQVVADLKNTPNHPLSQADDWYTFSAPGPGSLRGLTWYHSKKITPSTYRQAIMDVASDLNWEHCMQDLQNCMCEFDKYCRVLTGAGRSKRTYPGV